MASYHLGCLALTMIFTALTLSFLRPDIQLDPWHALLGLIERRMARRLARKKRQVEEKMQKYWVIDMRKLR